MTNRDYAVDVIKEITNLFGKDIEMDRADLYRSRKLLIPNMRLSDEEDNNLVLGKIIVSEFHNGIPQLAFEIADLNWKSFSSCDDKYIINVAIRLCKQYKQIDKLNELLEQISTPPFA